MQSVGLLIATLLAVGCCVQVGEGLRILVISPFNSRSHDAMSDRLGKALAAKGHQVDAYSHYPAKSKLANYQHHSLEGTLQAFTNNLSFSEATTFQSGNLGALFKQVAEPVCNLMGLPVFEKLRTAPPVYDVVLLQIFITDCFLAWARHLQAPFVGVTAISSLDWLNGALGNPSNAAIQPSFGTEYYPPMNFWQRFCNTLWGWFGGIMFSQVFEAQNQFVERYFGADYPSVFELRRELDLLIVNSHHSLDGVKAATPTLVPSAGIHIPEVDNSSQLPSQVQQWLDDSKDGCVYFTFGSMVRIETLPRPTVEAVYAAFQQLAPVRVLMKIAKPQDLPPGLPSNVMTQTWFSQVQVFKHKNVKAFITHGGMMSSIEAIDAGIPMIGIPIFGDQHQNVRMNVRRGISTVVPVDSLTADRLAKAIKDVLYEPSYKENMDKLSAQFIDRPMPALDTAIYWIEYVARHGKKCLRSPLADMPWWQANLVDVYGLLFVIVLLVYYILKFVIKKLWAVCCANKNQRSPDKVESKKKR